MRKREGLASWCSPSKPRGRPRRRKRRPGDADRWWLNDETVSDDSDGGFSPNPDRLTHDFRFGGDSPLQPRSKSDSSLNQSQSDANGDALSIVSVQPPTNRLMGDVMVLDDDDAEDVSPAKRFKGRHDWGRRTERYRDVRNDLTKEDAGTWVVYEHSRRGG